jgi:hypothetical protein
MVCSYLPVYRQSQKANGRELKIKPESLQYSFDHRLYPAKTVVWV